MRHQLTMSADGLWIAHYAPPTETLTVHRLPAKQSAQSHVYSIESLSLRISPVSSLCMHPEFPVLLGVPLEKTGSSIPRGPSSLGSSAPNSLKPLSPSKTSDTALTTTKTKTKIQLTLFSFYSRPMVFTPLIVEVEAPADRTLSPWCIKYSPSGKYLAVHARSFSNSGLDTINQIYIFDTKNNYSLVTSTDVESGIEDLDWNHKSDTLIAAGSHGQLHLYEFDQMNDELLLKKSMKLSSSALSSICYYEEINEKDDISAGLLVGTRDGNTLFIDPSTMCCTNSVLFDVESPVLKVSLGPNGIGIVSYLSCNNEPAYIIRISQQGDEYEQIAEIDDIFPTYNAASDNANATTGCGALVTKFGIMVYVKKDGKVCFETLSELLSKKDKTKAKVETVTSKATNPKKRSADLFNKIKDKENLGTSSGVSLKKQKDSYGKSQREYWDSRQGVREREKVGREKDVADRGRDRGRDQGRERDREREREIDRDRARERGGRESDRDRERDSWRYKRVNRK